MGKIRWQAALGLGIFGLLCSSAAFSQNVKECGNLQNHYGPFDYRRTSAGDRALVEKFHFTPKVELLKGGQSGYLGQDLSYTLRVFPNNARALLAMSKLAKREGTRKPAYSDYTIECWFARAVQFAPDDPNVRMAYGVQMTQDGNKQQALVQFEEAEKLGPGNANIHYNLGLTYFELGDYEKSLAAAQKAYSMGFDLPGLRNKLKNAGKWQEPAPKPVSAAKAAPSDTAGN